MALVLSLLQNKMDNLADDQIWSDLVQLCSFGLVCYTSQACTLVNLEKGSLYCLLEIYLCKCHIFIFKRWIVQLRDNAI